ncbi:hypothetical protein B9K06_23835 [Bacillus sp. OG2]|nr:hypothetical protein B9K06_23835 [Bacillus sp. OG2]
MRNVLAARAKTNQALTDKETLFSIKIKKYPNRSAVHSHIDFWHTYLKSTFFLKIPKGHKVILYGKF